MCLHSGSYFFSWKCVKMFTAIIEKIDGIVWGLPTIILILATGLLLTIRLRGIQFTKLGLGFKSIFNKSEDSDGEVSSFGALCTALSATIGTGNIVGVATAIAAGGPGALCWMWVAALVGIATKYTECMLAVKYREVKPDGTILGGPFYTIEKGMKERTGFSWKWLAVLFAIFGVCVGLFGIGTFTQVSGITTAVNTAIDPNNKHVAFAFGTPTEESLQVYLAEHPEFQTKFDDFQSRKNAFVEKTDVKISEKTEKLNLLNAEENAEEYKVLEAEIAALEASKADTTNYAKTMLVSGKNYHEGFFNKADSHVCTYAIVIAGLLITLAVALVIIGGLQRISKVAEKLVPAMAIIYVFLGLSIIIMNATHVPQAFAVIFKNAFGFPAIAGGLIGWSFKQITESMQKGVARGIFSNEAGLGSAPIAASAVQTNEPVEQGLVNMTGTVIDTLIICTMTGLSIVLSGIDVWNSGLEGSALTSAAFSAMLGGDGHSVQFLLMLCLIFFAFTTILGWDYYSEKCLEYLTNGNMVVVKIYRWLYIIAVAIGPYMTISAVWTIADITNGLMAIPNCISLIVLSGVVAKETKKYFEKYPKLQ